VSVGTLKLTYLLTYSYLGRKILQHNMEAFVEGTSSVVWPHYSYWTLGYMLTYKGAWKLLQQNPLGKLLPVDEYLPIMFNKHPEYVDCVL